MTEINVNRLVDEIDPAQLSASVMERGANAGPETWANAKEAATEPLEIDNREGVKEYFAGFGAWDREEIAAWSDTDLDALVLQYAAGDLREAQGVAPGDGIAGVDWDEAEKLAQAGTLAGNLFVHNGELWISLSE